MERCEACGEVGTKSDPLNKHHYRGRRNYPQDVMRVHSMTCHVALQFLTNFYISKGEEATLTKQMMIDFYQKVVLHQLIGRLMPPGG